MALVIAPLEAADFSRWKALALGYKTFYETVVTDAEYEATWRRLLDRDGIFGLGAKLDGQLVGIAHYFFHTSIWAKESCYLQDLFVDSDVRGKGIARALIEATAVEAKEAGATRFYWMTKESNATARMLYDKVGKFNGFIRYDYPMG